MPEVFNVSPVELSDQAEKLIRPIGESALSISTQTRDALASLGYFYGTDDEVAKAFAEQWGPAVRGALQLLSAFGTSMGLTASNLAASAAQYQRTENINTEMAGGLGEHGVVR